MDAIKNERKYKVFYCRIFRCHWKCKNEYDLCQWHWNNVPEELQKKYIDEFRAGTDREEFRAVLVECIRVAGLKKASIPQRAHKIKTDELPYERHLPENGGDPAIVEDEKGGVR